MSILFVGSGINNGSAVSTINVIPNISQNNQAIVVEVSIRTVASTVTSVTDDGGNAYTFVGAINNGNVARIEIWRSSSPFAKTITQVTVNLSGTSKIVAAVSLWSGVGGYGVSATATGSTANPSIALTTQDLNNVVVAGFASQGTGVATALTGTLRQAQATSGGSVSSNEGGALTDNTVVSPGSVTNAVTLTAASWAAAALELRSVNLMFEEDNFWNVQLKSFLPVLFPPFFGQAFTADDEIPTVVAAPPLPGEDEPYLPSFMSNFPGQAFSADEELSWVFPGMADDEPYLSSFTANFPGQVFTADDEVVPAAAVTFVGDDDLYLPSFITNFFGRAFTADDELSWVFIGMADDEAFWMSSVPGQANVFPSVIANWPGKPFTADEELSWAFLGMADDEQYLPSVLSNYPGKTFLADDEIVPVAAVTFIGDDDARISIPLLTQALIQAFRADEELSWVFLGMADDEPYLSSVLSNYPGKSFQADEELSWVFLGMADDEPYFPSFTANFSGRAFTADDEVAPVAVTFVGDDDAWIPAVLFAQSLVRAFTADEEVAVLLEDEPYLSFFLSNIPGRAFSQDDEIFVVVVPPLPGDDDAYLATPLRPAWVPYTVVVDDELVPIPVIQVFGRGKILSVTLTLDLGKREVFLTI